LKTISNQGILFNKSNADLSWYLVEAVLRKLIIDKKKPKQSRCKCDNMVIGFKLSILRKAIK
jgi:hypothetical protein